MSPKYGQLEYTNNECIIAALLLGTKILRLNFCQSNRYTITQTFELFVSICHCTLVLTLDRIAILLLWPRYIFFSLIILQHIRIQVSLLSLKL